MKTECILRYGFWVELPIPGRKERVRHIKTFPIQGKLQHLGTSIQLTALYEHWVRLVLKGRENREESVSILKYLKKKYVYKFSFILYYIYFVLFNLFSISLSFCFIMFHNISGTINCHIFTDLRKFFYLHQLYGFQTTSFDR